MDDPTDPLLRLQLLQRELNTFNDAVRSIARLSDQLDACQEDLKRLLHRNRKSEASRNKVAPNTTPLPATLTIEGVEYEVKELFRQNAISAADALDLDELEAAMLCIRSQRPDDNAFDTMALAMRAVLAFHEQRAILLDCLRLLLHLSLHADQAEDDQDAFRHIVRLVLQGSNGGQSEVSAYWRKCLEGLGDIENFIAKVSAEKDKAIMTGEDLSGTKGEWLLAQRMFLTRQHESMAGIISYLIQGHWVLPEDYRAFLSRAAALEMPEDIAIHYLSPLLNGAAEYGADHTTTPEAANDLHRLFAAGPGQLQWRNGHLKAAATVAWLAEYSVRFTDNGGQPDPGEEARTKLFMSALADNGFRFVLAIASYLKPVTWHDPARTAIVDFLSRDTLSIPTEAPRPSPDFSAMTMRDLQTFTEAFVCNMPDTLRKLKTEEDDARRTLLSQSTNVFVPELDLERFMLIMALAFFDDPQAAGDFWSSKENNLHGFLAWTSRRLPTPRVAAFCMLLRSIASDTKSANHAHRFLLEDAAMTSGKMRKTYAVSWAQIFSELELYASSLKDRPSAPLSSPSQNPDSMVIEEFETSIMLDAYLGLAASICRQSPDARNWLLKDQTFHLGEVMFQLLRSSDHARVRACCLELLTALLTDKSLEVRNGMWVLLDSWISSGGLDGSAAARPPNRPLYHAKHYLSSYVNDAEAGAAMVAFLNALMSPLADTPDQPVDPLPFPEALGRPHRHEGIHVYVDFVMDAIFARRILQMSLDEPLLHLWRYECLRFAHQCLSTFNENIVLLASVTNAELGSAMETKSFARYALLHPFARVMEWLFDKQVGISLFASLQQNLEALNDADADSPLVQATTTAIQVLLLAWKLQPTYFDLVRPSITAQTHKAQPISATWTSIDEIFLSHIGTVVDIARFITCEKVDISLDCLALLEKIGASRKVSETAEGRHGSRIVSVLAPVSDYLTSQLGLDFRIDEWDLDQPAVPLKVVKATAVLKLLEASLKMSSRSPGMAHSLLGFKCRERVVEVTPGSPFDRSESLFHSIASCATTVETILPQLGHTSWLLSLKRGCLDIILKLAVHPLTARIVQPILRSMDLLSAISRNQPLMSMAPLWDGRPLPDPEVLLTSSACSVRDFLRIREAYFALASTELRTAATQGAYSVQEKIVSVLLGTIRTPTGEEQHVSTIFDLVDFFDGETSRDYVVPHTKYFDDETLSECIKDDTDTGMTFDLEMAKMYLILRKKQMREKGTILDAAQEDGADNEIPAILAALESQNNFAAIQNARLAAVEAWSDLMSLVVTQGGMEQADVIALSLQGLLVILPRFEKSLASNMDVGALLGKLTLTLARAIIPASQDSSEQTASVAIERLLSTFRVSLKVINDSSTDLGLRDVSYRTACAVLASLPKVSPVGRNSQAASARQLLQLVQNSGERLLTVATEDAFSGRGVTRVSALLFLDGLISLFQGQKASTQMLRGLMKLNFIPVLVDIGVGNVASAFRSDDETIATMAFYHTAMALLLRVCKTPDGAQLVVNSGLFPAMEESKLFSTDPDLGLDIDNPAALEEFYAFLSDAVRLMTATVVQKGGHLAKTFLQQHRFTVQAILKQATRGQALNAAEELCKLLMATGFLEDDQALPGGMSNGFS